jgi:UDP-3-O-[3-hydroxymyristoyl] glucosamine N-acyltransferase
MSAPMSGSAENGALLGDPRFFRRAGPFPLARLAAEAGGTILRAGLLADRLLAGVGPLQSATPDQVAVLHNPRYAAIAEQTRAGLVIVGQELSGRIPAGSAALVVTDPHEAWARVAQLFHPGHDPKPGVHESAVVDPSAILDPSAEVGPAAVIGARAEIGAFCQIGPGAVIGEGVVLGQGCRIGAQASVSHALLGARVYVYPGARIGQEGFGFAITAQGFVTVPQLGRVILHDDVEIGANATVDRGASHDTIIGAGSRIDNLIQIGHNVRLGRHCVMAAQSGISGSTTLEDFVQIGAQAGLTGHLRIGARARIGAQAGVMSDVAAGADVIGSPALPVREFFRNVAVLRRLARRGAASGAPAVAKAGGRDGGDEDGGGRTIG